MRIALLGGTGRIGGHVLSWALDAGHDVTALARSPRALEEHVRTRQALGLASRTADAREAGARGQGPGLTVVRGDALDEAAVAEAIAGADAVISALGPRGAKAPGLLAGAAANTVSAMRQSGTRRLICVSAAGAYITEDPTMNWLVRQILPRVLATQFADVRRMENTIRASGLDWTLVRASRLVNTPGTGHYRVSPDFPPRGGGKISRADVAHFIAAALAENSWLRAAPALAY